MRTAEGSRWIPVATGLAFAAILVLALNLRLNGLDRPHLSGDAILYVGLAFKLHSKGFEGYNARGIDVVSSPSGLSLVRPSEGKGSVLADLESQGVTYFDQDLHHIPYGFPMALVFSHEIFARGEPYFRISQWAKRRIRQPGRPPFARGLARPAPEVAAKQFYALVVPLVFSLLLLVAVFLLAMTLFENRIVALVAMFLMAISPIDLLVSQTIWADDMTAAFSTLGVVAYLQSRKREVLWMALLAGLLCGLSGITKQNGAFVVIAIGFWHLVVEHDGTWSRQRLQKLVFDRYLLLLGVGIALTAGHWFWSVYSVYGSPFHRPDTSAALAVAKTDWYRIVTGRPWYVYLLGIPYQNPAFALAYFLPIWLWRDPERWRRILLPVVWIAVYFLVLNVYLWDGGKEHRYMLPAYPAFAVAAAFVADRLREWLDARVGWYAGSVALGAMLIASASWSVPIGTTAVLRMSSLLMIPF